MYTYLTSGVHTVAKHWWSRIQVPGVILTIQYCTRSCTLSSGTSMLPYFFWSPLHCPSVYTSLAGTSRRSFPDNHWSTSTRIGILSTCYVAYPIPSRVLAIPTQYGKTFESFGVEFSIGNVAPVLRRLLFRGLRFPSLASSSNLVDPILIFRSIVQQLGSFWVSVCIVSCCGDYIGTR